MSFEEPFSQLTGVLNVYLAPAGTTEPDVDETPSGSWVRLGDTDGDQSVQHSGALTYFRDNHHQNPRKAVRPEEDLIIKVTLVDLTLESYAKIMHATTNVTSVSGPPATKKMALARGFTPSEYAVTLRGAALSPYGSYPGQYYIPRAVIDGEPELTWAKDGRPGIEVVIHALEDTDQAAGDEVGWLRVQTS